MTTLSNYTDLAQTVALNVIATLQLAYHHVPDSGVLTQGASFDYVIVGGGTAGCVLANRLTEDPNVRVAILETGTQQPLESVLPALFPELPGTGYDYNFVTEQDYFTGQYLQDKVPKITAGKMLSGSSGLDPMYNIRSTPSDFQRWVDASNDKSWGYEEMLKYYIRSENLEVPDILKSNIAPNHGVGGPVTITRQTWSENEGIIKSFQELGFDHKLDFNGDETFGVSEPLLRISKGVRQSTAEAFIVPVQNRTNLFIYPLTTASRVIFDENKNAIGVEAINADNLTVTISAKKEVVVSAGVMKSAQLLLLSGIGDRETLESWSIDVVSELPVGQGLRDQVGAVIAYKLTPTYRVETADSEKHFPVPVTVAYKSLDPQSRSPDYQARNFYFPVNSSTLISVCSNEFRYIDAVCNRFIEANKEADLFFSVVTNLKPYSSGFVAIRSTDPLDAPFIYVGTFKYPEDVDNLGKYIQDVATISTTEYFKQGGAEMVEIDLEYCNDLERNTFAFFRCYGRSMSALMMHASGSAALGSVVDSTLKVYGVQRLRVVDSAVFPNLNSGDLITDIIAVAEKGADLIKADQ